MREAGLTCEDLWQRGWGVDVLTSAVVTVAEAQVPLVPTFRPSALGFPHRCPAGPVLPLWAVSRR